MKQYVFLTIVVGLLSTITNACQYPNGKNFVFENNSQLECMCIFFSVDWCRYVNCANGGVCRQTNIDKCYTCDCKAGFTGEMCQIQETATTTAPATVPSNIQIILVKIFIEFFCFVLKSKSMLITTMSSRWYLFICWWK